MVYLGPRTATFAVVLTSHQRRDDDEGRYIDLSPLYREILQRIVKTLFLTDF